jgi:hypothetical protein
MSIKTRIAAFAVATIVATAGIAASTQQAQAGGGGGPGVGLGVGLATGLIVGSAIAASQQPAYAAYPVRRCWWQPQYNVFGQYAGSVRACNYNYY